MALTIALHQAQSGVIRRKKKQGCPCFFTTFLLPVLIYCCLPIPISAHLALGQQTAKNRQLAREKSQRQQKREQMEKRPEQKAACQPLRVDVGDEIRLLALLRVAYCVYIRAIAQLAVHTCHFAPRCFTRQFPLLHVNLVPPPSVRNSPRT